MIRAIIFDCFGVLYPDTYWLMADEYLGQRINEYRNELHNLVKKVDLGLITRDELWGEFAQIVGVTKEEVYSRLKQFSGLDGRILDFINNHKNKYKIGMISNVGHGFIERLFVERPASDYFDDIVLSSDVGLVKPDERIYKLSADRLGVDASECVFIDDLEKNVTGAIDAGMSAIKYESFEQFIKEIEPMLVSNSDN